MFDETLEKLYTWLEDKTPLEYQGWPARLVHLELFQRKATVMVMDISGHESPTELSYDEAAQKLSKR